MPALFQILRQIPKRYNQINIPQAHEAMDKFKMQAASKAGVNLTNGYIYKVHNLDIKGQKVKAGYKSYLLKHINELSPSVLFLLLPFPLP